MHITKYEHSCLDFEADGKRLLIDPGAVTSSIPNYDDIVAIIVTHVHADHFDPKKLLDIHTQNPNTPLYTVQAVADTLKDSLPYVVITEGQIVNVGPFKIAFFGGKHALIHRSVPLTDNVGLMVNDTMYYPGDSLTLPHSPVDILAVPIAAPWLKISEAMDFITSVKPKRVFPVHDALLSGFGMEVNSTWLQSACTAAGTEYIILKPTDSVMC